VQEDGVNVVEVGEVCVYFDNPVWLDEDYGTDEGERLPAGEKGVDFHPCNDVVKRPRDVEGDGGNGQPPGVDWVVKEYPESVPDTEEELQRRPWSAIGIALGV
jgi:hypothetical protein